MYQIVKPSYHSKLPLQNKKLQFRSLYTCTASERVHVYRTVFLASSKNSYLSCLPASQQNSTMIKCASSFQHPSTFTTDTPSLHQPASQAERMPWNGGIQLIKFLRFPVFANRRRKTLSKVTTSTSAAALAFILQAAGCVCVCVFFRHESNTTPWQRDIKKTSNIRQFVSSPKAKEEATTSARRASF